MKPGGIMAVLTRFVTGASTSSMPVAAHINPQMTKQSETLRRIMTLALFGAGVVCTFGAVAMVLIIWLGGWTSDTQAQRLDILSYALLGMLSGMLAVIASFAIGGPVGRLKAGNGIMSLELDGDTSAPVAQVTTTTTVAQPAGDSDSIG